jgi:hypothetical protein
MRKLSAFFGLLICIAQFAFAQQQKNDSLDPVQQLKRKLKYFRYTPFVDAKVFQSYKIDSTFFAPSKFVKSKTLKKKDIAKVRAFSHTSGTDIRSFGPKMDIKLFSLTDSILIVNNKMYPENNVELKFSDVDSLLNFFKSKKNFVKARGGIASCFFPRHTFIFYGVDNSVIAYFEVCFECDSILTSPNVNSTYEGGFTSGGEPKFKEFCKRIGLNVAPK